MLTRTKLLLPELSNAERRVGEWLLAHPQLALEQDTRALARQIGVSQPTLVRFARSLGCAGFDEYRLRLAHEIGRQPEPTRVTLASLASSKGTDELCRGVFDFSLNALAQVRDQLDRDALALAIKRLDQARHVMVWGIGPSLPVAEDARRRLLSVPLAASSCVDAELRAMTAATLDKGDVLLLVAGSTAPADLDDIIAALRHRGVWVLLLASSRSPLAALSDALLVTDVADSGDALTPAVAPLAQRVVVDVLAMGVAHVRAARLARRLR